jgi:hypothetical protein
MVFFWSSGRPIALLTHLTLIVLSKLSSVVLFTELLNSPLPFRAFFQ